MGHRRGNQKRNIFLIIDITSSGRAASVFEKIAMLCERFDSEPALHDLPIHWRFPAGIFDNSRSADIEYTISRLRTRIASGTDMILPAGYTELPHQALLPGDVELDLLWCGRHPETSERRATYGPADILIFPKRPDTARESISSCYLQSSYSVLVAEKNFGEIIYHGKPLTPVSVVQYELLSRSRPISALKRLPVAELIFLVIEDEVARTVVERREFQRLVTNIRTRGGYRFEIASSLLKTRSETTPEIQSDNSSRRSITTPLSISERESLRRFTYSREAINRATRARRDKTSARDLDVLRGILPTAYRNRIERHEFPEPRRKAHPDRILVSDMTGDIVLAGEGVFAMFEAGRLSELQRDGVSARFASPASSWISIGGVRTTFVVESAFSFEEPEITGLQQRLVCRSNAFSEPVRLDLDTFFVDNSRYLFIHTRIIFPECSQDVRIPELHPLNIALRLPTESVSIESRYPDGETVEKAYTDDVDLDFVWGTSFEVRGASHKFILFTPELDDVKIACLPVRAKRFRKETHLTVSPGGLVSSETAGSYSGSVISSLFGIDIVDSPSYHVPILTQHIADRLRNVSGYGM